MGAKTDEVTIRDAVKADLAAITAIYGHAVLTGTASYEIEPPALTEMTARFTSLRGGDYPYLVAENDGNVIGYAYAGPFRPRPAYRYFVEDSLYLAPQAQGKGIGRRLLAALIARCEARGFRQIVAVIGDGHPGSASVRLHERLGFRHCGRLEGSGHKFGRWLDTALMQLAINGGATTAPEAE